MQVKDADFDEKVVEQSKKKVVVADFWAAWCMPCQMLSPLLDKIVKSYDGKVVLAKINVDDNPEKSDEYGIDALPGVKIFKDGKVVKEFTGVIPEDKIRELIDKALK